MLAGLAGLALIVVLGLAGPGEGAAAPLCNGRPAGIIGTAGNDVLRGTSGADVIHGGGGNDTIDGRGGDDVICGGSGSDTILGRAGKDRIFGGSGRDDIRSGSGADFVSGGPGADTVRGGNGHDVLHGDDGADLLYGSAGADVLRGQGGEDRLYGGDGADTLRGGGGADRLYGGDGADEMNGGSGADAVWAEAGHDTLYGGPNNDLLRAGSGDDRLYGGDGTDALHGGAGADRLWGEAGNDQLHAGTGGDVLRGGPGNDWLRGDGGNDKLFGEAGADALAGGPGSDACDGGPGKNRADGSCESAVNVVLAVPGPDFPVGPTNWSLLENVSTMKTFSSGVHVVENVRYLKGLVVTGSTTRVTLRNCHVIHPGSFWTILVEDGAHLTMEDCQIGDETSNAGERGVGVNNVTLRRVKIVGHEDGIKAGSDSLYEQVWIENLRAPAGRVDPHFDGIQDDGGHANWVLRYSRVEPEPVPGGRQTTSAALIKSDLGSISGVLLEHNILDNGAYTIHVSKGNNFPIPSDIVIRNNGFGRDFGWGVLNETGTGVTWQGNYWVDTLECIAKSGAVIGGVCGP